ncbi:hypothetical protein ZHAS_00011147 [Anopheles sinensis]|uniref:BHLH domain-containing protein n=1 Tax=Anopheles sinensis TaxID=74873 RepID=A0A084VZF9_ANOSI|nr:hypothetical protein ZHAS_00011147 [Anopheles sinensis]
MSSDFSRQHPFYYYGHEPVSACSAGAGVNVKMEQLELPMAQTDGQSYLGTSGYGFGVPSTTSMTPQVSANAPNVVMLPGFMDNYPESWMTPSPSSFGSESPDYYSLASSPQRHFIDVEEYKENLLVMQQTSQQTAPALTQAPLPLSPPLANVQIPPSQSGNVVRQPSVSLLPGAASTGTALPVKKRQYNRKPKVKSEMQQELLNETNATSPAELSCSTLPKPFLKPCESAPPTVGLPANPCTATGSTIGKRKRKQVPLQIKKKRRLAANARERKRMQNLNDAFDRTPAIPTVRLVNESATVQARNDSRWHRATLPHSANYSNELTANYSSGHYS